MILDNGRSRVRDTAYRSVLNCIRCGACQNVCPVYRQVGGTAYGWVYGGPIGAVLTPLLHGDQELGHAPRCAPPATTSARSRSRCTSCSSVSAATGPPTRRGRSSGSHFGSGASPGAGRGSTASPSGSPAGRAVRCPSFAGGRGLATSRCTSDRAVHARARGGRRPRPPRAGRPRRAGRRGGVGHAVPRADRRYGHRGRLGPALAGAPPGARGSRPRDRGDDGSARSRPGRRVAADRPRDRRLVGRHAGHRSEPDGRHRAEPHPGCARPG